LDQSLIQILLVFHDVLATALLLLISWQVLVAFLPSLAAKTGQRESGPALRDVLCVLLIVTIGLGSALYPTYRFAVRPYLESNGLHDANGAFEIKEQFAALAIVMLPAYRAAWDRATFSTTLIARRVITGLLCAAVWWNFAVGHLMNSIKALS